MWGKSKNKLKYEDLSSIPKLDFDPELFLVACVYSLNAGKVETRGSLCSLTSQPGENCQAPGPNERPCLKKQDG